jgi:phage gp46-like protein
LTDIALAWDPAALAFDWALSGPDLLREEGLRSAVAVSLFSDGLARADDAIPDGTDDRRGWWGDLPRDGRPADPIGSRLWLLAREKRTEATRRRAEEYARDALAWMLADGVAAAVDVSAAWGGAAGDQLRLVVTIRREADGLRASEVFEMFWTVEAAR